MPTLRSFTTKLRANIVDKVILVTSDETSGISIVVPLLDDLSGGTLTIGSRSAGSKVKFEPLNDNLPLPLGEQIVLTVGAQVEIAVTLTGATTPVIDLRIAEVP